MAIAKLANGIDELHGAVDSIKEGKKNRMHLICRWRPQGPQSYAPDGSKLHEFFFMRFPEGPRSEGYQRNFNLFLSAQRMAHDIERVCYHPDEFGAHDIEQAQIWQQKYADYLKTIPKGSNRRYKFYGWMFTQIYRGLKAADGENNP